MWNLFPFFYTDKSLNMFRMKCTILLIFLKQRVNYGPLLPKQVIGQGILQFLKDSGSQRVPGPKATPSLGNLLEMIILSSHPDQLEQRLCGQCLTMHMDQMSTKGWRLVKAQVDGSILRVSISVNLGWGLSLCPFKNCQMMLMQLVYGPHFEYHCPRVNLPNNRL